MQSDDLGLVERLEGVRKWLLTSRLVGHELTAADAAIVVASAVDALATKDAAIERLIAERDEAREALKPFADLANDYMTDTVNIADDVTIAGRIARRDEEGTPPRVTFGDFRRAHLVDKKGRARQALEDAP